MIKREALVQAISWINLENTILSDGRQHQKAMCLYAPLGTGKPVETKSRLVILRAGKKGVLGGVTANGHQVSFKGTKCSKIR